MEKINKLSLPATILLASIILGVSYYVVEVNKQQSIERQQQLELRTKAAQDTAQQDAVNQAIEQAQNDKEVKQKMFDDCMTTAHEIYVSEVTSYCLDAGYTQTEVGNLKCKAPAGEVQHTEDKQTQAQAMCLKLYK